MREEGETFTYLFFLQIKHMSDRFSASYNLRLKTKNADMKLTFIPLIFIFLRVWGVILGIIYIYSPNTAKSFREKDINAVFVMLSVSLRERERGESDFMILSLSPGYREFCPRLHKCHSLLPIYFSRQEKAKKLAQTMLWQMLL